MMEEWDWGTPVTLYYNETGPGNHVEYMCDSSCNLISTAKLVLGCQVNSVWDHQPAIIQRCKAYVDALLSTLSFSSCTH